MEYKKDIIRLLNSLRDLGWDRRRIEKKLNYREKYLDQALSKGGNPKLLYALQELTKAILKDSESNSTKPSYKEVEDELHILEEPTSEAFSIQAIRDLARSSIIMAESNKVIADSNKVLAESNKVLADNNQDLIKMVKNVNPVNSDEQEKSLLDLPLLRNVFEKLAKAGTPELWASEDEGMIKMGRYLAADMTEKQPAHK